AQGDRSPGIDQGNDGEADARRPGETRRNPYRRRREAVADPDRGRREAERDSARGGPASSRDPAGRGAGEGDRYRLPRDPRGRRRSQATRVSVLAGPPADRTGRVQQGLDHPERGHEGARTTERRAARTKGRELGARA